MRKRYVLGAALTLALVAVMAFGAIGSGAWFTDEVTLTGNKVEAGTLKMELSSTLTSPNNMAPGDTIDLGRLTLTNAGSLSYKFRMRLDTTSDEQGLANVLKVTLTPSGGFAIQAGTLAEFANKWHEYDPWFRQGPGEVGTVDFQLEFSEDAGNEYQGAEWQGTLTIQATQIEAAWGDAFSTSP